MKKKSVAVLVAAAILAVFGVACLPAPPTPPCIIDCSYGGVTHQSSGDPASTSIQFVGDSLFYFATAQIKAQFTSNYRVGIDAVSGSTTNIMLPHAETDATSNPDIVVIDLGGNDASNNPNLPAFDEATVEADTQAMNSLFPNSCVIWVTGTTAHSAPKWHPENEAILDAYKVATFPHVADWGAASDETDSIAVGDPHLTDAGSAKLASFINQKVDEDCVNPPPEATSTTVPEETTTVPEETTTIPDETTVPEESTVPEETTVIPDDPTSTDVTPEDLPL